MSALGRNSHFTPAASLLLAVACALCARPAATADVRSATPVATTPLQDARVLVAPVENESGEGLSDSFVSPQPMEVTGGSVLAPPSAVETIRTIRREAELLRARRSKPADLYVPSPRPAPPPPLPPPPPPPEAPKIQPPPPPKPIPKLQQAPTPSPAPHLRLRHPIKAPHPHQLPPPEPSIPRIVAWNAGPPLCGSSDVMCGSKVLRTTCHITAGNIIGIGENQDKQHCRLRVGA